MNSPADASALAHPNVALVKYWGKRPGPDNVPAVPSLSIGLGALATRTRVRFDADLPADSFILNGVAVPPDDGDSRRVREVLDALRVRAGRSERAHVESTNDFPTGAGLASSASGFAALVLAADRALGLGLATDECARIARRASASAARSLLGGYVALQGDDDAGCVPRTVAEAAHWPLQVLVAICAQGRKAVGSSAGMRLSAATSPFYPAWVGTADADLRAAEAAIAARDFAALAAVTEHSTLKMHGVMLASQPALAYWNPASLACMQAVRDLRANGIEALFTLDAGPQVKVVTTAADVATVEGVLAAQPGVLRVVRSPIGAAARCVE